MSTGNQGAPQTAQTAVAGAAAQTAGTAEKAKVKAPEVRTVKMSDGRVVEFTGKQRLVKSADYNKDSKAIDVRLDFDSGDTRAWSSKPIPDGVPGNVIDAACHGYGQKFGDECSGLSVSDSLVKLDELIARFKTDAAPWNARGDGGTGAGAGAVIKALMEVHGMTREKVMEVYETFSPAEKRALRLDETLAPVIKRIEAEELKAAPKTNTAALMGKFGKPAQGAPNSAFAAGDQAAQAAEAEKAPAPAPAAPAPKGGKK